MVDIDAPVNDGTLTNIDTNTTNLANFPRLVVCRHNDNKDLMSDDWDDSSTIRITPHFEPIKTGKESYVSPIYLPEIHKPAPW